MKKRKKDRSGRVALIASLIVMVLVGACVFSLYSMAGGNHGLATTVKSADTDGSTSGKLLTIAEEDLQEAQETAEAETAAQDVPATNVISETPAAEPVQKSADTVNVPAAEEKAPAAPAEEAPVEEAPAAEEEAAEEAVEEAPAEEAAAEVFSAETVEETWTDTADYADYTIDAGQVPDYGYISTDEYYVDGSWYTGDADYDLSYDYSDLTAIYGYDPFAGIDPYTGEYYGAAAYTDPYAGIDPVTGLYYDDLAAYSDPYAGIDPVTGLYYDDLAAYTDASAGLYDTASYTDTYIDPVTGYYMDGTGYYVDPSTGYHFDATGNYVDAPQTVSYTDPYAGIDPVTGLYYDDIAAAADPYAGIDPVTGLYYDDNAAATDPYAGIDPVTGLYYDDTAAADDPYANIDPVTGLYYDDLAAAADDTAAYTDLAVYAEPEETYTYNSLGQEIVNYALGYVGVTPYVWAGRSLTSGTDCSGFVHLIYDQFGIYCSPASMAYDGSSFGYIVSSAEAQPGDIAVYGGGAHVAIYAGNGKVVHCSSPENGTVCWDMDYRSDFSWFLRVIG